MARQRGEGTREITVVAVAVVDVVLVVVMLIGRGANEEQTKES